jgi:HlyD family secretion protein
MKIKILLTSLTALIAALIVIYFIWIKNGDSQRVTYETEEIDRGNVVALVDTTGTVNPVVQVEVGSQVSGKISEIYVDFNARVEKGEIIARLDPELFETRVKQDEANYQSTLASLEKARVTLKNTKAKLDRALEMFERELISYEEKESAETSYYSAVADLQSAEARLAQAESQLESSRVDLTHTIIKSPIDGVVVSRDVNEGQTVAASLQAPVLFTIANDLTQMQVECEVDEADIGKVEEGQKVRFSVDAYPSDIFNGTVRQVRYSPVVVSNVVTYTTIVDVENPELKLRPGMTATVSIVVGEARNALRVPNSSLRFTPSLSQEEMQALHQETGGRRQGGPLTKAETGEARPRSTFEEELPSPAAGLQEMGRVWMQNENGGLKMVFLVLGVTDNIYTEIKSDNLEAGQEIIVGENGKAGSDSDDRRRMMPTRMIR